MRDRLIRTRNKLNAIDATSLNAGKRTDYDSAGRFLAQAEAEYKDFILFYPTLEESAEAQEPVAAVAPAAAPTGTRTAPSSAPIWVA